VQGGRERAAIFGVSDGLVSNVSLILGVAGAGPDPVVVALAGITGLISGASSMAAGEYISMRVQREIFERLIHIEAHELASDPEGETAELAQIFRQRGIPIDLSRQIAERLMEKPQVALAVHAKEELGLDVDQLGSPWGAAGSSFLTFALGALVPLSPFMFGGGAAATLTAVGLALGALFAVGGATSLFTDRPWWVSGSRQLAIGGVAALITYGIGRLLGVTALA
jgi:VIT1/CCC1 family predicted Fe2+/Mn2+ transporter